MANNILEPTVIAKEALFQLENNIVMGNVVHRDYVNEFKKIGDTVTIRKPVKFVTESGAAISSDTDVEEGSTTIVISEQEHVSWKFDTKDLTLTIEEYSERYLKPAMISLADKIDRDLYGLYSSVPAWVGTPGETINSFADLAQATQRLDEMAVPMGDRYAALSPADAWAMLGAAAAQAGGLEGPRGDNAHYRAYRDAFLGRVANLETFQAQNIVRHTVGEGNGTPLVDGASQGVNYADKLTTYTQSLVTDGWDASQDLKAGDVITLDGVFAVNPVGKATLDFLQPFVLTADVTTNATTTNDTTLTITPPIITSGPYQTVSAAPADDATITYIGTASTAYPQNLVFHRNAFALVSVPMVLPNGAAWSAQQTYKGLSVRIVQDYDFTNDRDRIRCDVLYGVKAIYPELAVRASGAA